MLPARRAIASVVVCEDDGATLEPLCEHLLREIREADGSEARFDPRLPVIALTGRGADAERVRGLECGADDYKAFHYPELRARMPCCAGRTGLTTAPPGRRPGRRFGAAQGHGRG